MHAPGYSDVIAVLSGCKKIVPIVSICSNVCTIVRLILTALKPWTRYKVLLNGSPNVRMPSSSIPSDFERHSISPRWPFLSRGAGRARARCAHVPPKTLTFFYLRITTSSSTWSSGSYTYEFIPVSFVKGYSRRSRTDFAYTKRKVDERSLTFQFVVWSGYDRSILFKRNGDKEGAR